MSIPQTRREYERRCHLLSEQIREGKFRILQSNDVVIDSLAKIRCLPNKRIDLLSIDESARLQMNMLANFDNNWLNKINQNDE